MSTVKIAWRNQKGLHQYGPTQQVMLSRISVESSSTTQLANENQPDENQPHETQLDDDESDDLMTMPSRTVNHNLGGCEASEGLRALLDAAESLDLPEEVRPLLC